MSTRLNNFRQLLWPTGISTVIAIYFVAQAMAQSATPHPLEIYASSPIQIYFCPGQAYRSDLTLAVNESYTVLGWNIDIDGYLYFLVEQGANGAQIWVNSQDTTIFANDLDYRSRFPRATTCQIALVEGQTAPVAAFLFDTTPIAVTPLSGIPLEERSVIAVTATPALIFNTYEISNQQLATLVQPFAREISNLQIQIVSGSLSITGDLLGQSLSIQGTLVQEEQKLRFIAQAAQLSGSPLNLAQSESVINNSLSSLLAGVQVQSLMVSDGMMQLAVIENANQINNLAPLEQVVTPIPTLTLPPA